MPSKHGRKGRESLPPFKEPGTAGDCALKSLLCLDAGLRKEQASLLKGGKPEAVHKFRVAIRKIRSLLSQFKGIFRKSEIREIRNNLSFAAKAASSVRELDVFLLEEKFLSSKLSGEARKQAKNFFARLKQERAAKMKELKRFLASAEWQGHLKKWEAFIGGKKLKAKENAGLPVKRVFKKNLRKQLKRLGKSRAKARNGCAQDAHRFRIECKNTRYLMEFSVPSLKSSKLKGGISKLKVLQEKLGNWHDLRMQRQIIRNAPQPLHGELDRHLASLEEKADKRWRSSGKNLLFQVSLDCLSSKPA